MAYESESIEWKRSWSDKCYKVLAGFSNVSGGILILGKDDDGTVYGLKSPEKLMEDIPNGVKDKLRFIPALERFSDNGRECIRITVRPQKHPVYYDGQYYVRAGSVTTLLEGHELTLALMKREGISWTDRVADGIDASDLSKDAVDYFVGLARDKGRIPIYAGSDNVPAILKHLDLLEDGKLRIAGALLFHPEPDHIVLGTTIDIGVFSEDGALLRDDVIRGPLIMQPDKAVEMLYEKHIQGTYYIDGMERKTRYDYPKAAIRESIMNAVIHKEYSRFLPVTVRIYPDRLEIFNHGKLPEGWTIDRLIGEHGSEPRNFRMAKVFYDAGRIERWGVGIGTILRSCRDSGMPDPKFEVFSGGLRITFTPAVSGNGKSTVAPSKENGRGASVSAVLSALASSGPMSTSDLIVKTDLSRGRVNHALKFLSERGDIEKQNGKKGVWKLR